jgi:hypothetical protein
MGKCFDQHHDIAEQPQTVKQFIETVSVRVNFGQSAFNYPVNASPFGSFLSKGNNFIPLK